MLAPDPREESDDLMIADFTRTLIVAFDSNNFARGSLMLSMFASCILAFQTPAVAEAGSFLEQAALDVSFQPDEPSIGMAMLNQVDADIPSVNPFVAKSWRFHIQGGYAFDTGGDDSVVRLGVGWEYFLNKKISLSVEVHGLAVERVDVNDTAYGGNINLLLRWYFHEFDSAAVYLIGGAGIAYTSENIPAGGTEFNFSPQAGIGVSFDLDGTNRLDVSARWYHFSNANIDARNPGIDTILLNVGISVPF